MDLMIQLIHYASVALCGFFPGIAVSLAQARVNIAAFKALNTQPAAQKDISQTNIIALALIETSGILGVLISLILFFHKTETLADAISQFGASIVICLTGFMTAISSAAPAEQALMSIARQPFSSRKIANLMMLCQSLIQTSLAFGFIVALFIFYQLNYVSSVSQSIVLLAAGLCLGLASIGPAIGGSIFTKSVCKAIGLNEKTYGKIISFTIISQAVIETPIIFAVIVSLGLLTSSKNIHGMWSLITIAIAFLMGIGTLAPGIASGKTAASAADQLPFLEEKYYNVLSRTTLIAQGLIDTSAINAMIISIILIVTLG